MLTKKLLHFGIRERLITFSLLLAIPLVLVGLFALWGLWEENKEQLDDSVEQQSQLASIAFERWIDDQQRPLSALVADTGANGRTTLSEGLPFVIKTHPDWLDILQVSGTTAKSLVEPGRPANLSEGAIEELKSSIDGRRKTWSVLAEQASPGEKSALLLGVRSAAGEMLVARMSEDTIADIFSDLKLGTEVTLTILDANKKVLYNSKQPGERGQSHDRFVPTLDRLRETRTAIIESAGPSDGVQRIYGLAYAGETDCYIMIGIPSAPLREPGLRQFIQYAALSFIALVAAVLAAIWFSRLIVSPIDRLANTTRLFGTGNLKARAEVSGTDEIAGLASTFNQMAEQIEEREEKLTELDKLKSEFVSSVSHELRTPLTTIKTLTRILLRGNIGESDTREYLETIAVECDRQIDLILNLLNLSRIESGTIKFDLGSVDVGELLTACERVERHAAEAVGHSLVIAPFPASIAVSADRNALRRVLCILIENAIKYTPSGGQIVLDASRSSHDDVLIKVRDNGIGIAESDLPCVFDKFFRVQEHDEGEYEDDMLDEIASAKGLGLGLYLARSLVDRMDGELSVESAHRKGTTFTIRLPAGRQKNKE